MHTLLLGALAGTRADANEIEGRIPSADALRTASSADVRPPDRIDSDWQLANWPALEPDGGVAGGDTMQTWI